MLTPANAQLMIRALQQATALASIGSAIEKRRLAKDALLAQLEHRNAEIHIKADVAKTLIASVIDRRIDAVQGTCEIILAGYAEQERHFMSLHSELVHKQTHASSAYEHGNAFKLIQECTQQLASIRSAKERMYKEMVRAVLAIGGDASPLARFSDPLLPG